ncbi:hypothetical protein E1162_14765 [Rhodobacteraceae bacterium RKSG542]|uniref:hypothetical protein n=1 Tax=Pseudovibrio flavus TaxID=2529854 RepID=UPI0012BC201C|nr:hypothetical protein [Pseudovibrio flavus]MTI18504.1 hypothetical protein [Pseudovibrio flavus]
MASIHHPHHDFHAVADAARGAYKATADFLHALAQSTLAAQMAERYMNMSDEQLARQGLTREEANQSIIRKLSS